MTDAIPNLFLLADSIEELREHETYRKWFHHNCKIPALLMMYCAKGSANLTINSKSVFLSEHTLLIEPVNFQLEGYTHTPDFECTILCLHKSFCKELFAAYLTIEPYWWDMQMNMMHNPVIHTSKGKEDMLNAYIQLLRTICRTIPQAKYRSTIVKSIFKSAILTYLSFLPKSKDKAMPADTTKGRGYEIYQNFMHKLQEDGLKHRNVNFYAASLAITPKYLNLVCKKQSRKTASEVISNLIVGQIKHELVKTDNTIKMITDRLGFVDTSQFCKYVRTHLGMSPMEYRRQYLQGHFSE